MGLGEDLRRVGQDTRPTGQDPTRADQSHWVSVINS